MLSLQREIRIDVHYRQRLACIKECVRLAHTFADLGQDGEVDKVLGRNKELDGAHFSKDILDIRYW